jgi:hypothetical protein
MLYLRRSQINVPRDRPLGKLSPAPQVAAEGLIEARKEAFFEKAGHCKHDCRFFKIHGNAIANSFLLTAW